MNSAIDGRLPLIDAETVKYRTVKSQSDGGRGSVR
jgi:hypothetical protein